MSQQHICFIYLLVLIIYLITAIKKSCLNNPKVSTQAKVAQVFLNFLQSYCIYVNHHKSLVANDGSN